jgi:hypothetical protein
LYGKPTSAFYPIRKEKIKSKIMKWLTLERIKQQCRIEQDFHDEDEILELYGESAEEVLMAVLNRTYEDLFEEYGRVPMPVVHASLMLVAKSYKDRESDMVQEAHENKTFCLLLKPYMRLTTSSAINNNNEYGRHCNL